MCVPALPVGGRWRPLAAAPLLGCLLPALHLARCWWGGVEFCLDLEPKGGARGKVSPAGLGLCC